MIVFRSIQPLLHISIEKREEISILKCIGASPSDITISYIFTGLFAGLMGTFTGLSAGLLISININEVISGCEKIVNALVSLFSIAVSPFFDINRENIQLLSSAYYLDRIPVSVNPRDILIIFIGKPKKQY